MTILANGQVAVSKATIFTVDGADVLDTTKVQVEKITLFNNSVDPQTPILFIKEVGGTSRVLRQFILQQNEGGEYLEPGEFLPLNNGDEIEAQTTDAAAVDFVVFGERL